MLVEYYLFSSSKVIGVLLIPSFYSIFYTMNLSNNLAWIINFLSWWKILTLCDKDNIPYKKKGIFITKKLFDSDPNN